MKKLTKEKSSTEVTIKKAAGTLNKVADMISDDKYCVDIIQQIDATIGLLKSAKKQLLEGHLHHCLQSNLENNKQTTIDELIKIYTLGQK